MNFEDLTIGQKNAFNKALEAIGAKRHLTIRGPAGTGKTTLMKFLLDELFKRGVDGVVLTAPTHQAKKQLSKASGRVAHTIHSVFKINPVTLEENAIFEQRKTPDLSKMRVLIVDECSMPDNKLFDIVMNSIPSWCTVIGVGDKAQLRPIDMNGNVGVLSPFFTDPRFEQVELTEIRRQGDNHPIIEVATDIRNGKWIYPLQRDVETPNGMQRQGVVQHTDMRQIMMDYFSKVKHQDDFFENRMMAYTNKSVDLLVNIIRKHVMKVDYPIVAGEVLVMQEPFMEELTYQGKKMVEIIFNNGQNVRVNQVQQLTKHIKARGLEPVDIDCLRIHVKSIDDDEDENSSWMDVIVSEDELNKFYFYQAKTAQLYKSGTVKAYWKDYWSNKSEFVKVRSLAAQTIHKAQGSTFDNSYLFTGCIHCADAELAQMLLYVGTTRARYNVGYI